jgi:putative membrane protein
MKKNKLSEVNMKSNKFSIVKIKNSKFFTVSLKKGIFFASIIIFSVAFIFSAMGFTAEKGAWKNETVYVVLNHDGSIKDERVVNWVYGIKSGENWVDYGNYSDVSNMVSGDKPGIEKDKIIWPMTLLESGALYYQGITDKELPIEINIGYWLDGKIIKGEELAGKSGKLKIVFKVKNNLINEEPISYIDFDRTQKKYYEEYYTPFMVQISVKADTAIFSDIVAKDAVKVVVGEEMNISFGSYPYPEDEFIVEMNGKNIELDPISITVVPKEIPFPDMGDAKENLTDMADGVLEMEDGAIDIIDGLDKIIDKSGDFEDGSRDLVDAISEINHGTYTLNNNSGEIDNGFSGLISGIGQLQEESITLVNGLGDLDKGSYEIGKALSESASGLAEITLNTDALNNGISGISTNHASLVAIAQGLADSPPAGSTPEQLAAYQQLLAIALGEQSALNSVSSGMQGITAGITGLSGGLGLLSDEYGSFSGGLNEIAEGVVSLPAGIGQLSDGQEQLYDGWEKYSDAISSLYDGTQKLYDETKDFPNDVSKLTDGIRKIKDGISELTTDGIVELKDGVVDNINDLSKSEALEKKTEGLSKDYKSFMDNKRNLNSSVEFIMQTQEIKPETAVAGIVEENPANSQNQGLWHKIIEFFRK